ncbi:MAG: hypothetical protein ISEC1_P0264 [Thiomicrorhabdus sp.]|nr:MAG: hypothetical protein ISEC1_P0264 [Thiomicrorhabdus sp.]
MKMKMKMKKLLLIMLISTLLQGCFVTKIVTIPMRVVGTVISIVPIVGDPIDSTIGAAADVVDLVPI